METENGTPQTLLEAVKFFSDTGVATTFMENLRWPGGPICPHCHGIECGPIKTRRIWRCKNKACRKQFSVKVGTIFEDSPIGLDKWLPCVWLIANCKNGISSYEVARALGVTQKTAWFMLHRVRLAMQTETFDKFGGHVEADETFIGGRSRFMHKDKRERVITGTGGLGKVAVMGLLERTTREAHSRVRVSVVPNTRKHNLIPKVRANVEPGTTLYTDSLLSYEGLDDDYIHGVIDHSIRYVDGMIHTNGLENFWSLLKRAIKGTYVSVEPFHLFRYLDEQAYRYNNRLADDAARFLQVVRSVIGKRLTYAELTAADEPQA